MPNVSATDECQLTIEAFANSNVDWQDVSFRPSVEIQTDCNSDPLVSYPVVGLGSYNFIHELNGSTGLSLTSGSYNAIPDILHDPGALDFVFNGAQGGVEQPVYVVVKSGNKTIAKRAVVLSNTSSSLGNAVTHFTIKSSDGQIGTQIGSSYSSDAEAVFINSEIVNNDVNIEFFADQGAYSEEAIAYVRDHLIGVQIQNSSAQSVASKSKNNCNFFYRKMDVLGSHYKG